jgi:thiamine transporter ThiT
MRLVKESLLSFLVVGIVLCLYFVAAGAVLFGLHAFPGETNQSFSILLKSQRT